MYSFKIVSIAAFLLFINVQAQSQYYITPDSVPLAIRNSWCTSQTKSCPLLCLQLPGSSATTKSNTCDPKTLSYQCICGNGLQPNATEFSQTLPYFICTEWGQQCIAACNGVSACQSACIQDHPCGAQNPTRVNITSTSSMMSATATATDAGGAQTSSPGVYNGLGGSPTPTDSANKSASQATLDLGRSYDLGAVVIGLFVVFALVL